MGLEVNKMNTFWRAVGRAVNQYGDLIGKEGYLEIIADGILYRSLPPDHHGTIVWISWEPFKRLSHFSALSDPDATVRWKET